jgi:hypothetical protein
MHSNDQTPGDIPRRESALLLAKSLTGPLSVKFIGSTATTVACFGTNQARLAVARRIQRAITTAAAKVNAPIAT